MTDNHSPNTPPVIPQTPSQLTPWQRIVILWQSKVMTSGEKRTIWRIIMAIFVAIFVLLYLLGWYWSAQPDLLNVKQEAQAYAEAQTPPHTMTNGHLVNGYVTSYTLAKVTSTLYEKPGGYLSNDMIPPGVFLDDMPSWEFGVLQQVRDFSKTMRNEIGRAQSLDEENPLLAKAEPRLNHDSQSWMMPPAEKEYKRGVKLILQYTAAIADPTQTEAHFFSRADNLRDWLRIVTRRLGSLSKRLNASVGEVRQNTDLVGEPDAKQSATKTRTIRTKTPWLEIDNVFYESRGTAWALINLLRAIEVDFEAVLKNKNALPSLRQIISELESTQGDVWSPVILNGSNFGFFANHSLVMSAYISRANAGLIELRELLAKG